MCKNCTCKPKGISNITICDVRKICEKSLATLLYDKEENQLNISKEVEREINLILEDICYYASQGLFKVRFFSVSSLAADILAAKGFLVSCLEENENNCYNVLVQGW